MAEKSKRKKFVDFVNQHAGDADADLMIEMYDLLSDRSRDEEVRPDTEHVDEAIDRALQDEANPEKEGGFDPFLDGIDPIRKWLVGETVRLAKEGKVTPKSIGMVRVMSNAVEKPENE